MPTEEKQMTAMQELKNEVESRMNSSVFANEFNAYKNIYNYINNELLATERQQLIDAYKQGCKDTYGYDSPDLADLEDIKSSETYYNQTFKPQ